MKSDGMTSFTVQSGSAMARLAGMALLLQLTALVSHGAAADAAQFPGKQSEWNSYARYDFEVDGKPVLVVAPKTPAPGRPWVWHGEFFGHKPAPDIALLGKGFHIVYMRVPNMLGCPMAVQHWNAFYKELTQKYGFAKKAALVGLSRGGLYCYNWATANPDKVVCIYGDAPVCDFKSWPGGKGNGKGSPRDWNLVLETYGFKDEAAALTYDKNPVDNLKSLAKAKVPLLHVYGDADNVVPWKENTGLIAERYRKLGGSIKLIGKPGVGHHPHGLDDSTPIIEFIAKHAAVEQSAKSPRNRETPLSRFAFGSCVKQDRPQPIWDSVVATRPQFFTLLGDNIYGDTEDMDVLKAKYQTLGNHPGYRKLKASCPILATWDDHDYGVNDGGAEYAKKRESQKVFLDFFDAPQDDIRRKREGVYSSQVFGPKGRRVQLILLDARYFRSPLKTGYQPKEPGDGYRGKYAPNTDANATVLGKAQWQWLEEQLQVPAQFRFIGSGVQVIADEHGSEMWGNFPLERKRLFLLIRKTKAHGVVFLSGDRHLAEIARLPANHSHGVGYPVYDITSSSLNTPSGNFTKAGTRFANEINSYRVGLTYFDTNFGAVQIDWEQPDPLVRIQVRDAAGTVVLQQKVRLSELKPAKADGPAPRRKPSR